MRRVRAEPELGELGQPGGQRRDARVEGGEDAVDATSEVERIAVERPSADPGATVATVPRDDPGMEREPEVGEVLVDPRALREPFEPASEVVTEVADQPAEKRRQRPVVFRPPCVLPILRPVPRANPSAVP